MNIKHIVLSVFVSSAFWGAAQAQSVDDAVIISKEDITGSARMRGMGNAQTSLGGDVSALNGNPAGLGFFSRSDASFTLNYLNNTNKTEFGGVNNSNSKGNFGIDQAGVVFNFPSRNYNSHGWQNFNVGISYNKTQNYNNLLIYEGNNNTSSIVNGLTDIMDGNFGNDFANSNMVEEFADPSKGYFSLASEKGDKNQYNDLLTKGNKSKTSFGFGANYNNTFYIGATLGLTSFKYEKSSSFIENGWTKNRAQILADNPNSLYADPSNPKYDFVEASYELFDNYEQLTEGSGVDVKIGMIYKPTTDWNLGLTVATPTWTTIKDDTRAYTDIDFYDNETSANPFSSYESDYYDSGLDFNMTSPWRFALGATKFFNRGLLSADVEYITYNTTKYSNSSTYAPRQFDDINRDIKDNLQGAVNFRIGGEYLFTNIISGRAGFNYFGNPYKYAEDSNISGSLGLGFKLSNSAYLDLALVHQVNSYKQAPYTLSDFWVQKGITEPIADIKHNRTNALMTLGFKF